MQWRAVKMRLGLIFGILALALFMLPAVARAQTIQNLEISNFSADYYLDRDENQASEMSVNEIIVAKFPDQDRYHGILRAIPMSYQGHTLSLEQITVTDDKNAALSYTTYESNNNLVLKIGNPKVYVRGQVEYRIKYKLHNVISFYANHDELFWDINGDQWNETFGQVSANFHIPSKLHQNLKDWQKCLAGSSGGNQVKCEVSRTMTGENTVVSAKANGLVAKQTLSVALAFNENTFEQGPQVAAEQLRRVIFIGLAAAFLVLPGSLYGFWLLKKWLAIGRDAKSRGVIIPHYQPPKNLNALTSDYILQQKLRNLAISALLIELAVKNYLTIVEVHKDHALFGKKKNYELVLNRDIDDLPFDAKQALKLFFRGSLKPGTRISPSDLQESSTAKNVYKDVQELQKQLGDELVSAGYFNTSPQKIIKQYITRSSVLLLLGVGLGILGASSGLALVGILGFGLGIAGIIGVVIASVMPSRTSKGVEAKDHLKGLKDYIAMAEAERLRFGQSPEGGEKIPIKLPDLKDPAQKIKLFETLLPYAMLFGLEKQWAKEFEGLYEQPPSWFSGDMNAFSTSYLVSSIGTFNSGYQPAFSAPSSSSSSGFGGGGGAGGGGGGGGGGGW